MAEDESLLGVLQDEGCIVASHHHEAGALAGVLVAGVEGKFHGGGEVEGGCLLEEQVGYVPQTFVLLHYGVGVEAHKTFVACVVGPQLVDVGMPLPLLAEGHAIEFVALLGCLYGVGLAHVGLAVGQYGFAASVAVLIHADDGPSVLPLHGLQVHQSAVGSHVLEVEEPVAARGGVHPGSLVRAVDGGVSLGKYGLALEGAVGIVGTLYHLPACGHTSGGVEKVVLAVVLMNLGSLACGVVDVSVEDDAALCSGHQCLGVEFAHGEDALQSCSAACIGVVEVDFTVVVPQGAGVDEAFGGFYQLGGCPCASGVFGRDHVGTLVGVSPEDVEGAVVMPYGGCPHTVAMFRTFGSLHGGQRVCHGVAYDSPVHEVLRVEDGQTGQAVEAGCRHVVVVAHAAHVGVAVVGAQDGIVVVAVAHVGHPYVRHVGLLFLLRLCRGTAQGGSQQQDI